jgi:hypothetical protein
MLNGKLPRSQGRGPRLSGAACLCGSRPGEGLQHRPEVADLLGGRPHRRVASGSASCSTGFSGEVSRSRIATTCAARGSRSPRTTCGCRSLSSRWPRRLPTCRGARQTTGRAFGPATRRRPSGRAT